MRNQLLWVLLLYLPFSAYSQATQSIINVSGGSFQHENTSLEWSVGEMALVNQMISGDGSSMITHGLLQPFLLKPNNGPFFENFEVRLFPNPTYGKFEVHMLTLSKGTVHFIIQDVQGKIILNKQTYSYGVGFIEKFDLSKLAAGSYILKIDLKPQPGSTSKAGSYKIIKI